MFHLRWPSESSVRAALEPVAGADFTHPHEGVTRARLDVAPPGYTLDGYGCELGEGRAVFDAAVRTIRDFGHYPPAFTGVVRLTEGFEPGLVFATVARHFGFVSTNPCRIVFVVDEREDGRFGFGLGTLPGHAVAGEERFLVQLDPATGVVRYDVQAISRPEMWLARLGRPAMRLVQRRFQRESMAALTRSATNEGGANDG